MNVLLTILYHNVFLQGLFSYMLRCIQMEIVFFTDSIIIIHVPVYCICFTVSWGYICIFFFRFDNTKKDGLVLWYYNTIYTACIWLYAGLECFLFIFCWFMINANTFAFVKIKENVARKLWISTQDYLLTTTFWKNIINLCKKKIVK